LKKQGAAAGFRPGEIVDGRGEVLGRHEGIAHYTLGQRKGLNLTGGPWHVVGLDGNAARVVVAPPEEALITAVEVGDVAWIRRLKKGEAVTAKVRYQMRPASCSLSVDTHVRIKFDVPQKPTAPGQVAAFYAGDELLGGGIIRAVSA
ncbi:MAG: tRNA 2-thiouridine(34) synthase MnmA, partial [Mariprofundaceae bacterium]|nr:tRNA 2-thiouridine(34) synthase MnmA [Mariprofundaceae bacterium]